jgi:hypothetical protein
VSSENFSQYIDEGTGLTVTKVTGMATGLVLVNVHPRDNCAGRPCVVHDPSDHHMRSWPLHWDDDGKGFLRICVHGYYHPDPDQFHFWDEMAAKWDMMQQGHTVSMADGIPQVTVNPWVGKGIHDCDECCHA